MRPLPPPIRERTYVARVRPERIVNSSPSRFTVELRGATFHPGYQTFLVTVGSDTARFFVSSWDTVIWWLEDYPLFERLDPTTHLGLNGSAVVIARAAIHVVHGNIQGFVLGTVRRHENQPLARIPANLFRSTGRMHLG